MKNQRKKVSYIEKFSVKKREKNKIGYTKNRKQYK